MSAHSHCLSFHILYHGNNFETRTVSKANYAIIPSGGKFEHCGNVQQNPHMLHLGKDF